MIKLGIIVESFAPSQLGYTFVKQANELLVKRGDIAIYGFFENLTRPLINPNFALMNLTEVYGFDGTIVSTNAYQAYNIQNFVGPTRRILYAYDIDWRRNHGLPAEFFLDVFSKNEVWTRSEDYKKIIDNNFNLDCKINEDFDLEKFL